MEDLIIIGASGFGREVLWLAERINAQKKKWNILGFIDDAHEKQNQIINGYNVIGKTEDVTKHKDAYYVCAIGSAKTRKKIIDNLLKLNPKIKFATLIDPSVEKSELVSIGEGSIICAHTIITVNVKIGMHVIINLDCTIGHDAIIQDFVTLYPSVNVSGTTTIGTCSELGTGMQIIQGKVIQSQTILGAGAVVVKDIENSGTYIGVPAKIKQ